MTRRSSSSMASGILVLPVAVVLAVIWWDARRHESESGGAHAGFLDLAPERGIDFRMQQPTAEKFKVNLYDHGCGVAIADIDGDGHDDVLFLKQFGSNGVYRNRGDGTFENVTRKAGAVALNERICVGAAFGDVDNDGDQDLYITSTRGGNVLLENDGQGRFRNVTQLAGVGVVAHSQTPTFFDYDNDGYLDLFVTNSAKWTTDEYDEKGKYYADAGRIWTHVFNPDDREFNVLFHNNHDGTFSDVTDDAGLRGRGWSGDVAAFDYDEDGFIDLLVTNMFGMSQLYRNDGRGHFADVTRQTLVKTSLGAIGSKVFDFNSDGRLDLFITDMHSDMWIDFDASQQVEPRRKYKSVSGPENGPDNPFRRFMLQIEGRLKDELGLNLEELLLGNSLFRNEGGGKFTEVSDAAGMETFWPWGVCVGDFDNDGSEDVFIPSGMGFPYFYWPNSLLMNDGHGAFTDRAGDAGLEPPRDGRHFKEAADRDGPPRSSRCAAAADFDGDGKLDLMVNNFGDRAYYYKNQFPTRHYVAFRLRGTRSNRDAIGAVATLYCGQRRMVRQVQGTGGYLSQCSKTLHFGLGEGTVVDRLEIRWPSGLRQRIDSPAIDRLHDIVEIAEPDGARTTAPRTTAPRTTAPRTTAPRTTAPRTTAPGTTRHPPGAASQPRDQ